MWHWQSGVLLCPADSCPNACTNTGTNICTTLERRAENLHDEQVKAMSNKRSGKGALATYTQRQGKGAASGERNALGETTKWCGYCGKPGHTSLTCYAWKYGRNATDIWTLSQSGKGKGKSGKSNGKGKGAKGEVPHL